jgi:hypothetical protein
LVTVFLLTELVTPESGFFASNIFKNWTIESLQVALLFARIFSWRPLLYMSVL